MFSQSVISIGLAQSLFAAFLLATKKDKSISDWILVACLLTFALKFIMFLVHQQHTEFFDLQFSMGLIPLTFGAYFYLYTVYLVEGKTKFDKRDLLHALPFVVLTAMYFIFFKDELDFNDVTYFENDDYLWVRIVYGMIFFTSIIVYTVLTFVKLRQYRKTLNERVSFESHELRLLWVDFIFILFVLLFTTYFITGIINAVSFKRVIDLDTLSHIGLTSIAFSVSYFALRQSPSLSSQFVTLNYGKGQNPDRVRRKQSNGPFTPEQAKVQLSRLNKYMGDERPYLDPELALHDLAVQVGLSKNELTHLLNHHLGENFFTYVNKYRIDAVIDRFGDPEYDHFTIMAVAEDCGFHSKSTFNSLFKKHTGLTPSEYKKREQKSPRQRR